jgi:TolA-binding protein
LTCRPVEAEAAQRALSTCNAALGAEQCVLASEGAVARWYAVVRFDPERRAVLTIQLFDGSNGGARVAESELEFKERDSELERWASAGVVVAALGEENRLFQAALAAERLGQRDQAELSLNRLLSKYPSSPLAPEARRALSRILGAAPVP